MIQPAGGGPKRTVDYRNLGADYGSILVGIQVPRHEMSDFRKFLRRVGYPHSDETRNPAYRLFLG